MILLTRWDPRQDIQEFEKRISSWMGGAALTKDRDRECIRVMEWTPFVDITEDEKEYLIKSDLPEIKKEDVEIFVEDRVIFHLWQKGNDFPDGTVTFPQSLGHIFNQPK